MSFAHILENYRRLAFTERDKGCRFERLMHAYLRTDPQYDNRLNKIWLSDELLAKDRKDVILYNSQITVENIPAQAYDYIVNGKSAVEWIMERYQITTHKDSGITNDPNDWAAETGNPRYILDLLLSIINVSLQTVEIVKGLPRVRFEA